jgi:hypothetical protein
VKITLFSKPTKLQEDWRTWFAWHPVILDDTNGSTLIVWLEYVQRKQCLHYSGAMWRYRDFLND